MYEFRGQIHPELLNTPRLVADANQQAVWRWDQAEPFGVNTPDENPTSLGAFEFPLRFPGQYADKETGLSQNLFRDFDPAIGRYVQSDPLGLIRDRLFSIRMQAGQFDPQLNHMYAYAESNPVEFADPLGLSATITFGGVARGAGLGASRGRIGGLYGMIGGAIIGAAVSMCEADQRDQCEQQCNADAQRGAAFCHSMAAMNGRKGTSAYARMYRSCMVQVDANLIKCYQDCGKDAK